MTPGNVYLTVCRWMQGDGCCRKFTHHGCWFAGRGSRRAARLTHLPCHAGHAWWRKGNCHQVRCVPFGVLYPLTFSLSFFLFIIILLLHFFPHFINPLWEIWLPHLEAARAVVSSLTCVGDVLVLSYCGVMDCLLIFRPRQMKILFFLNFQLP